jgi:hypothetical protein
MVQECNLFEGLEAGDLSRLVKPVLSIDEYKSKMGDDADIIVVGFTIMSREPAEDLVQFIELSYDWVLDADISEGEQDDGNYIVFVEMERKHTAPKHIFDMLGDLMNLTGQKLSDWSFNYYKDKEEYPLLMDELKSKIAQSSADYQTLLDNQKEEEIKESSVMDNLRAISGVKITPKISKDINIINIQLAAGIR